METLLRIGLTNALSATVLAAAVAAAAFACRRRPALVHGLWLVVLLKLVAPPVATLELATPWPFSPSAASGGEASPAGAAATTEPPVIHQDFGESPCRQRDRSGERPYRARRRAGVHPLPGRYRLNHRKCESHSPLR